MEKVIQKRVTITSVSKISTRNILDNDVIRGLRVATITFEHYYFSSTMTLKIGNESIANTWNGVFTLSYSAPLAVGDAITISAPGGGSTFTTYYQGVTGAGELIVSNTTADTARNIFTNATYARDDALPTFNTIPFCFLAGTRIATPGGAVAIETLKVGDPVLTPTGETRAVKWLFVQTVCTLFADPLGVAPIRIRTGALGCALPARDLLVSADHALLLDGVLVQAGALVNGATITRERDLPERFAYYHVELGDHALILAEGVPAETFVDNAGRRAFDNWRDYEAIHGDGEAIRELDLPRIKSPRQLPASLRALIAVKDAA